MLSLFTQEDDNGALTVGELSWQIKRVLESDAILSDIAVEGEISGFKSYGSGHCYFTLKDDLAQVRGVIWRKSVANLRFRPKDGDRVVATGHVEFYAPRGEVSFIVDNLRFAGQGALFEAFERLKTELAADGLFDEAHKRQLPVLPKRIGLITSPSGAVIQDMLTILRRRWPLAHVLFIPSAVQGFGAADDLVRALNWAASVEDLDVVIIGRGGGSAKICGRSTTKPWRARRRTFPSRWFPQWDTKPITRFSISSPICARQRPARLPNWSFPINAKCAQACKCSASA